MRKYRIFVEDRSRGLYSGLRDVIAMNRADALKVAKAKWPPHMQRWGKLEEYYAMPWPVCLKQDRQWLKEHVERAA